MNKLAKKKDESQTISTYSFYQETGKRELATMILLHDYPLNIVDHVGFRRFLNVVQPLFKIPTRNTIKDEIKTIYKEEKKQLTNFIEKNGSRVAITTTCGQQAIKNEVTWLLPHTLLIKIGHYKVEFLGK